MYRDRAHRPEDHDRAVGAIQIADALIADCTTALGLLRGPERAERWGAARALHDDYPAIWTQLDLARRILTARGANTTGYDELRGQVNPVLAVTKLDGSHVVDAGALEDARCALDELRLAMPGADWREIDARAKRLAGTRLARRHHRFAVTGLIAGLLLATVTWATAIMPKHKPSAAMRMREELAAVVAERRARIDELHAKIGDDCDRPNVLELMKLFVMDGRFEDAKAYGDHYESRCGEDMAVRKWANAPKPKPRD
ncbi:MAG TPA: hypothetical protein VN253_02935 [Kofleriaceae bacterium]|nr:hypothetical protein [Kofleriaceae bacterium]